MKISFPPLPFAKDALEPHYPAKMLHFHYERHHRAYFDKLVAAIKGTKFEDMELEEIVKETAGKKDQTKIFNNAAQMWNHTKFWHSMRQGGGGHPGGDVKTLIDESFGDYKKFREKFKETAVNQFGSGWTWLTYDGGKAEIVSTPNAETPLTGGTVPVLACDVWEHAYYLEYQDRRAEFVDVFLDHLINWQHAAEVMQTVARTGAKPAAKRRTA